MKKANKYLLGMASGLAMMALPAQATVVQFQTNLGDFEVNLFDSTTPETVANFLAYIESGDYQSVLIHRSAPSFVVQGGGFNYDETQEQPVSAIVTNDPVVNEPVLSNVRGTIAMAKLGNDPNSATSQWYFNLSDNSENLDLQNGGFTVFGVVLDDGMDVIDQIAELPLVNFGGAFASMPIQGLTEEQLTDPDTEITGENYVIIESIVVTNDATDTFVELLPPEAKEDSTPIPDNGGSSGGSSGGGAIGWLSLLGLALVRLKRKFS